MGVMRPGLVVVAVVDDAAVIVEEGEGDRAIHGSSEHCAPALC